jgi:hypothetical protein
MNTLISLQNVVVWCGILPDSASAFEPRIHGKWEITHPRTIPGPGLTSDHLSKSQNVQRSQQYPI